MFGIAPRNPSNGDRGNGRLEEALQNLVQAQALFVQTQATFLTRMAELERANAESFAGIIRILREHSRILEALPEAVREKIGFKSGG